MEFSIQGQTIQAPKYKVRHFEFQNARSYNATLVVFILFILNTRQCGFWTSPIFNIHPFLLKRLHKHSYWCPQHFYDYVLLLLTFVFHSRCVPSNIVYSDLPSTSRSFPGITAFVCVYTPLHFISIFVSLPSPGYSAWSKEQASRPVVHCGMVFCLSFFIYETKTVICRTAIMFLVRILGAPSEIQESLSLTTFSRDYEKQINVMSLQCRYSCDVIASTTVRKVEKHSQGLMIRRNMNLADVEVDVSPCFCYRSISRHFFSLTSLRTFTANKNIVPC